LLAGGVRSSVFDSFKPYLHERLATGQGNPVAQFGESPSGDTPAATTLSTFRAAATPHRGGRIGGPVPDPWTTGYGRSPGGSPVSLGVSTRPTVSGCARSAPAVPNWMLQSGTLPGSRE